MYHILYKKRFFSHTACEFNNDNGEKCCAKISWTSKPNRRDSNFFQGKNLDIYDKTTIIMKTAFKKEGFSHLKAN